jgi:hypothetical protein
MIKNHVFTLCLTLGVFLLNLNLGSGFPEADLCSAGQDNPLIAAYCQKLGLNFVSLLIINFDYLHVTAFDFPFHFELPN